MKLLKCVYVHVKATLRWTFSLTVYFLGSLIFPAKDNKPQNITGWSFVKQIKDYYSVKQTVIKKKSNRYNKCYGHSSTVDALHIKPIVHICHTVCKYMSVTWPDSKCSTGQLMFDTCLSCIFSREWQRSEVIRSWKVSR